MTRFIRSAVPVAVIGLAMVLSPGCAAFRQSVKTVDVDKAKPMSAKYDYSDLRNMTDEMVGKILNAEAVKNMTTGPIVAIFNVDNRTRNYIDTQAMTDTMRNKIMESGKMRFVNTVQRDTLLKEQKYQAANASQETRVAIGKQLGAKYMLTGSLVQMDKESGKQVRVSSQEEIYYQFTVELTDLETGLVEVAPQVERARLKSKPLIGW